LVAQTREARAARGARRYGQLVELIERNIRAYASFSDGVDEITTAIQAPDMQVLAPPRC
jgi:hypothetical protein